MFTRRNRMAVLAAVTVLALSTSPVVSAMAAQQGAGSYGAGVAVRQQTQAQSRSAEGTCTRERDGGASADCDGDQVRNQERTQTQVRDSAGIQVGDTIREREQSRDRTAQGSVEDSVTLSSNPGAADDSQCDILAVRIMSWFRDLFAALRLAAW